MVSLTLFLALGHIHTAKAAKLSDGTWSQSASPGTTTITFTTSTALSATDKITLTFPATATIDNTGTNISVTGQTTPIRANNLTDNEITITLDNGISGATSVTITMTDGLSAYTSSTYAQESAAISVHETDGTPIDYGVALISNSNSTTVTAIVPLFAAFSVDDTTMSLGTLLATTVKEDDQTYTMNTNNPTGITVQIETDGNLRDGSGNDINYVSDGTVTAANEEYGISIDNIGASLTVDATYATGDNAISLATDDLATSAGPIANETLDINYKASIDGNTVAGNYTHQVTVTISTNP